MFLISFFQKLGRALQLPIAVLPIAALFLRFGQSDLFNLPALSAAGSGIFEQLPLIFSIGVASAWSIHTSGAAALAGAVSYIILTKAMAAINSTINMGALAGIFSGILAGAVYNRWHNLKLPDFLAFFGNSRSVPIISGLFSVFFAFVFGQVWPYVQFLMETLGSNLQALGPLGSGIYGLTNRLLLPTGLHQILNNYVWYQLGLFKTVTGQIVAGDMTRFFANDPSAGVFMSGFFPIMIFGLPSAALAMYHAAKLEHKKHISGILASVSFTALFTGITEPLEFLFMFLTPVLYCMHVLFTGLSLYLCAFFNVRAGFSFSAGFLDLLLISTFSNTQHLERLLGLGLFFSALYYSTFYCIIHFFNLQVPAAPDSVLTDPLNKKQALDSHQKTNTFLTNDHSIESHYFEALGGKDNLIFMEACITRLRIQVKDVSKCNESAIKNLGALGISHLDSKNLQIVVGTQAEALCKKIQVIWDESLKIF